MKRMLMLAIAMVATMTLGVEQADAQNRSPLGWSVHTVDQTGFGFPGYRKGMRRGGNGFFPFAFNDFYNPYSFNRPEPQPYFAMNPPVYYSDQIVRRPVGVSPFPAPPGVVPVEMTIKVEPQVMKNPYYKEKAQQVVTTEDTDT